MQRNNQAISPSDPIAYQATESTILLEDSDSNSNDVIETNDESPHFITPVDETITVESEITLDTNVKHRLNLVDADQTENSQTIKTINSPSSQPSSLPTEETISEERVPDYYLSPITQVTVGSYVNFNRSQENLLDIGDAGQTDQIPLTDVTITNIIPPPLKPKFHPSVYARLGELRVNDVDPEELMEQLYNTHPALFEAFNALGKLIENRSESSVKNSLLSFGGRFLNNGTTKEVVEVAKIYQRAILEQAQNKEKRHVDKVLDMHQVHVAESMSILKKYALDNKLFIMPQPLMSARLQ